MKGTVGFCDGVARRDFIRVGCASLFGPAAYWSLPSLLGSAARAGENPGSADARSLIVVFLRGGLSTIDTWDLKPNAPAEFRGEFQPIATNVAGIEIGEHLPRIALQMDKFSLVRSFGHRNSDHGPADHYMLTGYHPLAGFNPGLSPNNQRPSHGSIIARQLGPRGSVPAYVCVPDVHPSGGAAYLGPASAPFSINADPNDPGFTVRDVLPPLELDPHRVENRQALLARVDRFQRTAESRANRGAKSVSVFRERAFQLMTSAEAKRAFDIHQEDSRLRDEYGRNSLGQSCLMARRLVEAGVRCVTVQHVDWDTHEANFTHLRRDLLPMLDGAMATLFRDLSDRGLLDNTLVLVTGEFGRTPRINNNAGRDHWGPGFTVALGGGGIQGGRVIGRSDARAEKPADDPYGPEDLAATVHRLLGIDPDGEFYTPEGRPVKIVNDGRMIRGLT
ncbi:MAG: DUF1501 domain-containing protein [Planctomycetes bacterium]|nr:DUF1501 domain-containing protein [Planctomycetota bacterium]